MNAKVKLKPVKLTAEVIEAFAGAYLSPRYDQAVPTPEFHREGWRVYCSSHPAVDLAAPRGHAKSTAFTHAFTLANVCFRVEEYVIVLGSSEEKAMEHLGDIANELRENEDLIRDFQIAKFIVDQKGEIIVECLDGHQFRIVARGAEQKIRGTKWRGKRPGLIVGDDLEDDEQVENKDRRIKFRKWFFRAAKQALRRGGRIRIHGTILHIDSLLARLQRNRSWRSLFFKAHRSFSDFTEILWPGMHTEQSLKAIRQEFVNEGDSSGYSQEYLNTPLDNDDKYLHDHWFKPMRRQAQLEDGTIVDDYESFKRYICGVDFAISKANKANKTAFAVGGKDISNCINVVHVESGRWDSLEIIEKFFELASIYGRSMWFIPENGKEWKAIEPVLQREMLYRDIFLNTIPLVPIEDKKTRARPMQKRMKAGGMRFDIDADWFKDYKEQMLMFTGDSDAVEDDEFDATALMVAGELKVEDVDEDDTMTEEERDFEAAARQYSQFKGRSPQTGY